MINFIAKKLFTIAFSTQVCYNKHKMFNFIYGNIDFAHKIDNSSSPTEEYYKHMHAFAEILYLVSGDVNYTVESDTRKLQAGDLVFIAPGKYHFATVNLDDQPYERYVLKFPEILIPDYLKAGLFAHTPFFADPGSFTEIFKRLDGYIENFLPEEVNTLFNCELARLLVFMNRSANSERQNTNKFIDKIINYVDSHITESITLDSLAAAFLFSKSYICNEFKKHMKIPVMQYIRSKKILFAHSLITNGMKKCEAAEKVGFANYSTFFRAYRKMISGSSFPE